MTAELSHCSVAEPEAWHPVQPDTAFTWIVQTITHTQTHRRMYAHTHTPSDSWACLKKLYYHCGNEARKYP